MSQGLMDQSPNYTGAVKRRTRSPPQIEESPRWKSKSVLVGIIE
jgi:hypothetical protein